MPSAKDTIEATLKTLCFFAFILNSYLGFFGEKIGFYPFGVKIKKA